MSKQNILWFFLGLHSFVFAQVKSPFTNYSLNDSGVVSFSFLVSGHFHGSSQNASGFPAATLLANIDHINNLDVKMLCSTGDLFLDVKNNIPKYKQALFSKLTLPLFNAVGNHDLTQNIYQQNFGNTVFSFIYAQNIFVFLDTEQEDGNIRGEQYTLLKQALNANASHVFVFSHRPVWAEDDEKFKDIFLDNTQADFKTNFQTEILPLLKKSKLPVYWFSGSLGGAAPASFFYHKQTPYLTYIQSAIRDLPRDAVLRVNVNKGNISFETISLTGNVVPPLQECDLNLWKRKQTTEPFNYRLIPLYTKQMLMHRYFWYGIAMAFAVWFIMRVLRKRVKRKKNG